MERAHDAAKYGRPSERPIIEATIPSLADPSLVDGAAPGHARHERHRPVDAVRLRDGDVGRGARRLGDLVVRTLDGYAPGLAGLVTARQVLTPLDLERTMA